MIPQRFKESNSVMTRPQSMSEEQCFDIHACRTGEQTITCWRPTPEELVKINLGEPVWLILWCDGMPPVAVTADYPFIEESK